MDLRPEDKPALHPQEEPFNTCSSWMTLCAGYNPEARHERQETERFKRFNYEELVKLDKVNLDIFWLRDESMEDTANLPPPDQIAEEIVEDLRAALEQLEEIASDLSPETASAAD